MSEEKKTIIACFSNSLNPKEPGEPWYTMDYPFGFNLRCAMRSWIFVATKGAKRGQARVCSQTSIKSFNVAYTKQLNENGHIAATEWTRTVNLHLRPDLWNGVKMSNYYMFILPYIDFIEEAGKEGLVFKMLSLYARKQEIDDVLKITGPDFEQAFSQFPPQLVRNFRYLKANATE